MSDPVHNVRFQLTPDQADGLRQLRRRKALIALAVLVVGTLTLSVGVAGVVGSLWAGVVVLGLVLTTAGLLLSNNN